MPTDLQQVQRRSLLCDILIKNTIANEQVELRPELAVEAHEACSRLVDEYIASGFSDSDLVKEIDSRGEICMINTGIGCEACHDLREYILAVLTGDYTAQVDISDKYFGK